MEKFCPACSRVYNEDATSCDVDGERLVLLSEEPSLVGHVLDGKYTLMSKLGEGGMGSVYLAEQATMGREVAIKVLRREFSQNRMAIKRFLREARAASKLAHPNTITVYDFGQSNDGLLYLVMEKLTGRPLADILDAEGALPVQRAVHILSQICDSLSEAHKNGITHRDLKPENIFIEEKVGNSDFVKVLDFGIAKMQGDETTTQATAAGMICGTPAYMSPEQAMGKEIDGRSDIYALGVLLYEMLTNEKPFEGDTPMEVMLKHINEPSPDVYQRTQVPVPQGIQDALDSLLAKKPEGRPADCQAAKRLILTGMGTPLVGPVLSTLDPSLPRKRRDETNERKQALEKTGLSPAVAASRPAVTSTSSTRRAARPVWAWVAAALVLVGVATTVIALSGGDGTTANDGAERSDAPKAAEASGKVPTEPGVAAPGHEAKGAPVDPAGSPGMEAHVKPTGPAINAAADSGGVATDQDKVGSAAGEAVEAAAKRIEEVAKAQAVPAEPAKPERIKLEILSKPEKAQVYEGEVLLGSTPFEMSKDRDSGPVKLTLKLKGYRPQDVTVGTVSDVKTTVELKRAGGVVGHSGGGGTKEPVPGLGGTF